MEEEEEREGEKVKARLEPPQSLSFKRRKRVFDFVRSFISADAPKRHPEQWIKLWCAYEGGELSNSSEN